MLKGIFAILLFVLIVITILVMLGIHYLQQLFRRIRERLNNDYDETADRHHQNYTGRRQTQYTFRHGEGSRQRRQGPQQQGATAETIIDNRDPQENRKIFADDEGEYVEFTEES